MNSKRKRNLVILLCLSLLVLSSIFCNDGDKIGEKFDRGVEDAVKGIAGKTQEAADMATCTVQKGALVCAGAAGE